MLPRVTTDATRTPHGDSNRLSLKKNPSALSRCNPHPSRGQQLFANLNLVFHLYADATRTPHGDGCCPAGGIPAGSEADRAVNDHIVTHMTRRPARGRQPPFPIRFALRPSVSDGLKVCAPKTRSRSMPYLSFRGPDAGAPPLRCAVFSPAKGCPSGPAGRSAAVPFLQQRAEDAEGAAAASAQKAAAHMVHLLSPSPAGRTVRSLPRRTVLCTAGSSGGAGCGFGWQRPAPPPAPAGAAVPSGRRTPSAG